MTPIPPLMRKSYQEAPFASERPNSDRLLTALIPPPALHKAEVQLGTKLGYNLKVTGKCKLQGGHSLPPTLLAKNPLQ